jgi:hypothetical protein
MMACRLSTGGGSDLSEISDARRRAALCSFAMALRAVLLEDGVRGQSPMRRRVWAEVPRSRIRLDIGRAQRMKVCEQFSFFM